MKKIFAILMALCLLTSVAMAEAINWSDVEASITEAGVEGSFVSIAGLGVKVFVPDGFQEIEVSDEQAENGYICALSNADQTAGMVVTYTDLDGMSLEDYTAALPGVGATEVEAVTINGIPAVSYKMVENDTVNIAMMTDTGYVIEFLFTPSTDDDINAVWGMMAASIQSE